MKSADVKSNTYINSSKEINDRNLTFKIRDNVMISKISFCKRLRSKLAEEAFVVKKVKNAVLWTYLIDDLNLELKK